MGMRIIVKTIPMRINGTYNTNLKCDKIIKLLSKNTNKEYSHKQIIKITKFPSIMVFRIMMALVKRNDITVRKVKSDKFNYRFHQVFKIKTKEEDEW